LRKTATLPVVELTPFPRPGRHLALDYCLRLQAYFPIDIPRELAGSFPSPALHGEYALIHPGSGSTRKNYSPSFYLDLACELRERGYGKIGFIFGPVEQERLQEDDFAGEWIAKPHSLDELVDLLTGAALFIGNDSGVSHLSGFLGVPAIAFYKSTDPKIWGVLGRRVTHICAEDELQARQQLSSCLAQAFHR
jgi:ADP-heptose:LPS heptosyltransferase